MAAKKHVLSLPVYLGLFLVLLTLPAVLLEVRSAQDIHSQAAQRTFEIPRGAQYVPGQLIIKYKPTLEIHTTADINQHAEPFEVTDIEKGLPSYSLTNLQATGARRIERAYKRVKLPQERGVVSKLLGTVGFGGKPDEMANYMVIKLPSTANLQQAINILIKDPNVESVEPNYLVKMYDVPFGNDSYYSQQWSLPKIGMPQAWQAVSPGHEITVAVMDTGVDATHPDLQGKLVTGRNMIDGSSNTQDTHGHGTHVAGVIAAAINNGTGIAGISPQVKIMPIKVQEGGSSGTIDLLRITDAMRYAADNNAKVLNISLGFTLVSGSPQALDDTIAYVSGQGVTMVAAAGNDNIDMTNDLPSSYPQVIAVAASTEQDSKASFSNFGEKIAVAAPGVGILSAAPAPASMVYDSCADTARRYCTASGTSMAAPHVTGLVALMLSINNTLSPDQVRSIITANTDDIGAAGKDIQFGYGRINAQRTVAQVPSGNASASPAVSPSPSFAPTSLQGISDHLKAACGGQAAISKKISELPDAGRHWGSWAADYNGVAFVPAGEVYIYVKTACQTTLNGQQLSLNAGLNKVTLSATTATTQSQSTTPKRRNILQLLLGR